MIKLKSHKVKQGLYVSEASVETTKTKKVNVPVNHVFCCDISGSMYYSLKSMRNHLKNKIPDIVKKDDTVTIIVFESKNCCTTIKEMVHVNNVQELKSMNDAIDRYMVPGGCTCFYDPIKKTSDLIDQNKGLFNFIFLSDGYNNDSPWEDVVSILNSIQSRIGSSTIIEYGYYADSNALNQMAEILGGVKITASDFETYEPVIEKAFTKETETKKVIDISRLESKFNQFVYFTNCSINVVYGTDEIHVPTSVDKIYFLSNKLVGEETDLTQQLYALAYVSANNMRYEVVESILGEIGDVKFIEMYCNAFGKQKLFDFTSNLQKATFDVNERGKEINKDYKPNRRAYCVLDLLCDLQDNDSFIRIVDIFENYNRTSKKRNVVEQLTEATKLKLQNAKNEKELKKIYETAEYESCKMEMINVPYKMDSFVWNEDRANVSALVKIDVNIEMPKNDLGLTNVTSFVYRNCTIIKDGILNVKVLPVIVTKEFYKTLTKKTTITLSNVNECEPTGMVSMDIDISKMPIVNREYTHSVKASDMTEVAKTLLESKFIMKYLGFKCPDQSEQKVNNLSGYNEKQLEYLTKFGITEKGYNPQTEGVKSGETYMALTLKSVFNKMSTIPKVADVLKKIENKKKLTPAELLMSNIITFVEDKAKHGISYSDMYNQGLACKNDIQRKISMMKFGLIMSKKWFSDKNGFDDCHCETKDTFGNELTIDYKFAEVRKEI